MTQYLIEKVRNLKIKLFCLIKLHFQKEFHIKEELIHQLDFLIKRIKQLNPKRKEELDNEGTIKDNKSVLKKDRNSLEAFVKYFS